jgi:hypothetical protein
MTEALQLEIERRKFKYSEISEAYSQLRPTYFNSGCCCFSDGDISGIEIEGNCLRLIEWQVKDGQFRRMILEEAALDELLEGIQGGNEGAAASLKPRAASGGTGY